MLEKVHALLLIKVLPLIEGAFRSLVFRLLGESSCKNSIIYADWTILHIIIYKCIILFFSVLSGKCNGIFQNFEMKMENEIDF